MFQLIGNGISAIYNGILGFELNNVHILQSNIEKLEPLLEFVSEELNPTVISSYVGPLLGILSMDLMIKYLYAMGVVMLSSDILKWVIHEDRPYWWCYEKDLPALQQHRLTCETTSGLPSGHSAAIVAISYLIYLTSTTHKNLIYFPLTVLCLTMFTSRMYFGCHFLHQCIVGGILAFLIVKYLLIPDIWQFILEAGKKFHITMILCTGLATLLTYFIMIYGNIDPHWSVRMAFKWCQDPMHLSHTNSPVYSLFKHFGYMMGIALSAPLIRRTSIELNPYVSVPLTIIIMVVNTVLKNYTPTQSGRLAFISYGFIRNLFFTFGLLTVMSKYAAKSSVLLKKNK